MEVIIGLVVTADKALITPAAAELKETDLLFSFLQITPKYL